MPKTGALTASRRLFTDCEIRHIRETAIPFRNTRAALARHYGVSTATIEKIVANKKGAGRRKFTPAGVASIRLLFYGRSSYAKLAREWECDRTTMQRIIKRKTYRWVK